MIFYGKRTAAHLHAPRLATTARLLHRITQARSLILTLQLRVNLLHKHRPLRRLARLCTPRHALAATRCSTSGHLFYSCPRKYEAASSRNGKSTHWTFTRGCKKGLCSAPPCRDDFILYFCARFKVDTVDSTAVYLNHID